jgi:cytosine/adenosine deaminase-related metal-dependent hydrolase
MLRTGLNVCVGSDSLASNPSLSVLDELRYLRRNFADVDPGLILEMGTSRGARALGQEARVGTLDSGKSADIVVIPYNLSGPRDPAENVLVGTHSVTRVYVSGKQVTTGAQASPPGFQGSNRLRKGT